MYMIKALQFTGRIATLEGELQAGIGRWDNFT